MAPLMGALLRLRDAFGDRLSVGLAFTDTPDDDVAVAFVDHAWERFGIAALLSAMSCAAFANTCACRVPDNDCPPTACRG